MIVYCVVFVSFSETDVPIHYTPGMDIPGNWMRSVFDSAQTDKSELGGSTWIDILGNRVIDDLNFIHSFFIIIST
jgi:hypothetical protein